MNKSLVTHLLYIFLCIYSSLSLATDNDEERLNLKLPIDPVSNMSKKFDNYFDSCIPSLALDPYGRKPPSKGPVHGESFCLGATTLSPALYITTSLLSTTDLSVNSVYDPVRAAKDDAEAYIATDGKEYHTAKLERAFRYIRKQYTRLNITDMEAAHIIIYYNSR